METWSSVSKYSKFIRETSNYISTKQTQNLKAEVFQNWVGAFAESVDEREKLALADAHYRVSR